MTITDDEILLRAVADGDRAALRALYERHAPWLTLRLARRCPDPDLVDDAVQDTFVAVWRSAKRYDGQGLAYGETKSVRQEITSLPFSFEVQVGGNTPPKMISLERAIRAK